MINISGDAEGDHVQDVTVKGLPELWKLPHGGVLIRDAGYVVIRQTIEDDEIVSEEVLVSEGPHPDLDSGLNWAAKSSCRRSGSKADLNRQQADRRE